MNDIKQEVLTKKEMDTFFRRKDGFYVIRNVVGGRNEFDSSKRHVCIVI